MSVSTREQCVLTRGGGADTSFPAPASRRYWLSWLSLPISVSLALSLSLASLPKPPLTRNSFLPDTCILPHFQTPCFCYSLLHCLRFLTLPFSLPSFTLASRHPSSASRVSAGDGFFFHSIIRVITICLNNSIATAASPPPPSPPSQQAHDN